MIAVIIRDGVARYASAATPGFAMYRNLVWGEAAFERWVSEFDAADRDDFSESESLDDAIFVDHDGKRIFYPAEQVGPEHPRVIGLVNRLITAAWPGYTVVNSYRDAPDLLTHTVWSMDDWLEDRDDVDHDTLAGLIDAYRDEEDDDQYEDDEYDDEYENDTDYDDGDYDDGDYEDDPYSELDGLDDVDSYEADYEDDYEADAPPVMRPGQKPRRKQSRPKPPAGKSADGFASRSRGGAAASAGGVDGRTILIAGLALLGLAVVGGGATAFLIGRNDDEAGEENGVEVADNTAGSSDAANSGNAADSGDASAANRAIAKGAGNGTSGAQTKRQSKQGDASAKSRDAVGLAGAATEDDELKPQPFPGTYVGFNRPVGSPMRNRKEGLEVLPAPNGDGALLVGTQWIARVRRTGDDNAMQLVGTPQPVDPILGDRTSSKPSVLKRGKVGWLEHDGKQFVVIANSRERTEDDADTPGGRNAVYELRLHDGETLEPFAPFTLEQLDNRRY